MDFEEFIVAVGVSSRTIQHLKECYERRLPVDDAVHEQMMGLFHAFLVVGGMPEVVVAFAESKDIQKANEALKEIDIGYREDVAKYQEQGRLLLQDTYDLIPSELNSQNKRFIPKSLNKKARFFNGKLLLLGSKIAGLGCSSTT